MKFTTKGTPTAGTRWRGSNESADSYLLPSEDHQTTPEEHDRILAILAMGGNDVPPTIVRKAIDEGWSMDKAARAFQEYACLQVR